MPSTLAFPTKFSLIFWIFLRAFLVFELCVLTYLVVSLGPAKWSINCYCEWVSVTVMSLWLSLGEILLYSLGYLCHAFFLLSLLSIFFYSEFRFSFRISFWFSNFWIFPSCYFHVRDPPSFSVFVIVIHDAKAFFCALPAIIKFGIDTAFVVFFPPLFFPFFCVVTFSLGFCCCCSQLQLIFSFFCQKNCQSGFGWCLHGEIVFDWYVCLPLFLNRLPLLLCGSVLRSVLLTDRDN